MGVSLDGYGVGPDGGFDRTVPEEIVRPVTEEMREVGVHLRGPPTRIRRSTTP
jgi:hypothetical protein